MSALIALSYELGAEHRGLAMLGEGNTSAKLGESHAVKAAMFMADTAAGIFIGAAALGGPQFLSDENYRQRVLRL